MSLCHFFVWKYGCVPSIFHKELLINTLKIAAGISVVLIENYFGASESTTFPHRSNLASDWSSSFNLAKMSQH